MDNNERETERIVENDDVPQSSESDDKKYEGTPKKKKRSKSPFVFAGIVLASFAAFMYMQPKQDAASVGTSKVSTQEAASAVREPEEALALPPLGQMESSAVASGVLATPKDVPASVTQTTVPAEVKQSSTETVGRVPAASASAEETTVTAKASEVSIPTAASERELPKPKTLPDAAATGRIAPSNLRRGSVLMSCVTAEDGQKLICTPQERVANKPPRKLRYHNQYRKPARGFASVPRKPVSASKRDGRIEQRVVDEDSRHYRRLF